MHRNRCSTEWLLLRSVPDGQANLQTGMSPAPYPFETEIIVTSNNAKYSLQHSLQGSSSNGAVATPVAQSLDMSTGELSTQIHFAAQDSSWSVDLDVLQFVSQTVPALGLQQITVTQRTPPALNISIVPAISTSGLPGTPYQDDTPPGIFGEGTPYVVALRSNIGSSMAIAVQTGAVDPNLTTLTLTLTSNLNPNM